MASINKSDMSKDRKGHAGKGDFIRNGFEAYRESIYWKRSSCCNAKVESHKHFYVCLKCCRDCNIK